MGAAKKNDEAPPNNWLNRFSLAPETVRLLQVIESTTDEDLRQKAINDLAQGRDRDSGRVLIETFERCLWRSTKMAIVRALGPMGVARATEFLIDLAGDREDLAMAAEAILALGFTNDPWAGEFLLSILNERDHPLHREATIALSQLLIFPCEDELAGMFDRSESDLSPALKQYLILALGRRGHAPAWERIKPFLTTTSSGELGELSGPVFNAALIAAGMVGGQDALDVLRGLDIRYRFFAHHLKLLSTERLELRLRRSVEDAVVALLAARSDTEITQAQQFLREFPIHESWEAFKLLGLSVTPAIQVRVRVTLFDPQRCEDDLHFLSLHWQDIDWGWAAGLVRLHQQHSTVSGKNKDAISVTAAALPPDGVCALFMRLRYERSFRVLSALVADEALAIESRTKAVNAIVAQAKMTLPGSKTALEAASLLLELFKTVDSRDLKGRLVRALGQVRHESDAFLISLAAMLKDQTIDTASIYSTLALIGHDEAARVIMRRMARIASKADSALETKQALTALAVIGRLPTGEELPLIPETMWPDLASPLLSLLAYQGHESYDALIRSSLGAKDFQTRIMAIAAAKHAPRREIQEQLFAVLQETSPSLVGRAVDSLCVSADLTGHRRLLTWISEPGRDRSLALKVMASLKPTGTEYNSLIRDLDRLVQEGTEVFADPEVKAAAINLRDNLQMRRVGKEVSAQAQGAETETADSQSKVAKKKINAHSLDADLAQVLEGYDTYSEMVKTVLRNGELTFKHTDLFDDRVDKSTMIVEFVKSIDLLLQEKIGAPIFLDQQSDLLARMQSRIVQLQLDDDSQTSAQLVKDLQCSMHFTANNFPSHKLITIGRAIVSGKIVRDQYSTIDGLRAWAMLLLIFGRRFKFRQTAVEPLLRLSNPSNPFICELAFDLNNLQELRNQAAHRGTMLQSAKLLEIRTYSFKVLNGLKRAFS